MLNRSSSNFTILHPSIIVGFIDKHQFIILNPSMPVILTISFSQFMDHQGWNKRQHQRQLYS